MVPEADYVVVNTGSLALYGRTTHEVFLFCGCPVEGGIDPLPQIGSGVRLVDLHTC